MIQDSVATQNLKNVRISPPTLLFLCADAIVSHAIKCNAVHAPRLPQTLINYIGRVKDPYTFFFEAAKEGGAHKAIPTSTLQPKQTGLA